MQTTTITCWSGKMKPYKGRDIDIRHKLTPDERYSGTRNPSLGYARPEEEVSAYTATVVVIPGAGP
jgi:hypothetical protein